MAGRPADIVSPTSGSVLLLNVSPDDATAAGRIPYDKPTPDNSVMLFTGHQIVLMTCVRDFRHPGHRQGECHRLGQDGQGPGDPGADRADLGRPGVVNLQLCPPLDELRNRIVHGAKTVNSQAGAAFRLLRMLPRAPA